MVMLVPSVGVGMHPLGPLKFGGNDSCGSQILPKSPLHETGKKLTCLQSLRVKRLIFCQKMVILVSLPGVGLHPLGSLKLGGDGSYWSQILTTIPLHDKGKKLTFLQNLRVKRLSFSQKMVILVSLPGVGLHPLRLPKFGGDGSHGSQNFLTCPHHDIGKTIDLPAKSWSQMVMF